jgi:hypothetical protein
LPPQFKKWKGKIWKVLWFNAAANR